MNGIDQALHGFYETTAQNRKELNEAAEKFEQEAWSELVEKAVVEQYRGGETPNSLVRNVYGLASRSTIIRILKRHNAYKEEA